MRRRTFSVAAVSLAAAKPAWSHATPLPFTALGACTELSNAEAVRAAGGDYVEEAVKRFLIPDQRDSDWQRNLDAAKASPLPVVACNSFLPKTLRSTGPDANHPGILQYAEIAFQRGAQAGIKVIVFGSGGSRQLPEGFPLEQANGQFVSLLKKIGPLAEAHGITIAVEPLRRQECNFINTVIEGAAIVGQVTHPKIRLLCDLYHMLQNGEDPKDLETVAPLLVHCHIAEKEKRSAPGVMGDDFRPFFSSLKAAAYKGRISIEGKWQLGQLPEAYRTIREQARMA
jgi:sugar phosphate isomerase/epimerase